MHFICEAHHSRKIGKGEYEYITEIRTDQGDLTIKEFVIMVKEIVKKNEDKELFEYLKHLVRSDPHKPNTVEGIELSACKMYSVGIYNIPEYIHYDECQEILRKKNQLRW